VPTQDVRWQDSQLNIPSLLPLQAVPEVADPGLMLQYLQALHHYLADDRQKIARAINVISYYRNLFGIEYDDPATAQLLANPNNSKAQMILEDTGLLVYDSDARTGVPAWNTIVAGSALYVEFDKVAEPVVVLGPPPVSLDPHVVVDELPGDTSSLDPAFQPSEFVWTNEGDVVTAILEIQNDPSV
jgi:hypothetical protein